MNGKITIKRREGALGHHSKNYQVFLNDYEITNFVRSVNVKMGLGAPIPIVTVELAGIVELPNDIISVVTIYRDEARNNDKNPH